MPLSVAEPRSSNSRPEPATRSSTVPETTTSPASACAATRAPMFTAMPATLPSAISTSPVCRPARTSSPSVADRIDDRLCAADRARGPVEGREEPVARGIDLAPVEAGELASHRGMVLLEQVAPAPVAELGGLLGRADEIGEQHRRQHAIGRPPPRVARSGTRGSPRRVVIGIEPGTWSSPGSSTYFAPGIRRARIAGVLDVADLVVRRVDDQRRHVDRRHDVADVDVEGHAHERLRTRPACARGRCTRPRHALAHSCPATLGAMKSIPGRYPNALATSPSTPRTPPP